ncbi:MAG: TonB-dependent receptor, partial [Vicinamibacterales bacterium]|nr:TonB-dependent receptor [Vicinamibacterales bacterium]
MLRCLRFSIVLLALFYASHSISFAQTPEVLGTVSDPTGLPIEGAMVRLLEKRLERGRARTDASGKFTIPASCDHCSVEISRTGFVTAIVAVAIGQPVDAKLALGGVEESVVVTATGLETPETRVGASVTVLGRETIEQRHAISTIDLLRTVPGVIAVRTGGVGGLTSLFVRGGESTYNKVLLDGVPLNEPGGSFNFASISPENIERIEVLRGAHSALFGSDAMASVIQLFTTRPDSSRPQINFIADAGNYNTAHVAGGVGARTHAVEYSLFGSRLRTDNREPNNENRTTTVSGRLAGRLSSGADLRLVGRGEFGKTGVPGTTAFGRPDMDAFFKHSDGDVLGGWNQTLGARVLQQASYAYVVSHQRSTNLHADPPYTPAFGDLVGVYGPLSDFLYDSGTDLQRHRVDYRADASIGPNQTLTAAFAYDGERGVLTDYRSTAEPQRPKRNNTGTTVQYEGIAGPLSIIGGLRFEHNG